MVLLYRNYLYSPIGSLTENWIVFAYGKLTSNHFKCNSMVMMGKLCPLRTQFGKLTDFAHLFNKRLMIIRVQQFNKGLIVATCLTNGSYLMDLIVNESLDESNCLLEIVSHIPSHPRIICVMLFGRSRRRRNKDPLLCMKSGYVDWISNHSWLSGIQCHCEEDRMLDVI